MSKVKIQDTIGAVFVVSNGDKRKVSAKSPETPEEIVNPESVSLKDGDEIITGPNSYVWDISDQSISGITTISLGPESRIQLTISGQKNIKKIRVKEGICQLMTPATIEVPW